MAASGAETMQDGDDDDGSDGAVMINALCDMLVGGDDGFELLRRCDDDFVLSLNTRRVCMNET
jgi:hypothetical protein